MASPPGQRPPAGEAPAGQRRAALPIDAILCDVVAALRRGPAVVVQAPPGAGKTTRLPLALLDAGLVGSGQLLMLEPRRIAARAAALTMARSLGENPGQSVGFQVRFEKRESAETKILVVTEGILTRRFGSDPFLEGADGDARRRGGVSIVVLDEFHERSVHTDLCLALLKELMAVRDDLKVVVMSATLDADAVAGFLAVDSPAGKVPCPVVTSQGRPYPVTISHIEKRPRDDERHLDDKVVGALRTLLVQKDDDGGDVLCFLPGAPEIRRVMERIERDPLPDKTGAGIDIVPLYGSLSSSDQDRALFRGNRRRIVLATNVAETSLTLEGVTAVVDTGLMKSVRYDPRADRERLELVKISQASAEQRAGRAGRTRPGRALRLWTVAEHQTLPVSHAPEIHRTELSRVLLDIALFSGADPRDFGFFEPPPKAHLDQAVGLLRLLGALDKNHKPTARAKRLARLPLSPRSAAVMLAAADLDVIDDAAFAVAILEDDRALQVLQPRAERSGAVRSDSDLQVLLEKASDDKRLREVHQSARELMRLVSPTQDAAASSMFSPASKLTRALLSGFPDRLCRRRRAGEPDALMVGGRGVRLAPESGVVDAPLFLALSLEGHGASSSVRVAEAVTEDLLRDVNADAFVSSDEAVFDAERGGFVGVRRLRFVDLVISEKSGVPINDDAVAAGLAAAFAADFARAFRPDPAAVQLRQRILFARQVFPDEEWPAVDDAALIALLPALCLPLVRSGKRKIDDVTGLDWRRIIEDQLSWTQKQKLDDDVPARLPVPTGNHIGVDYAPALVEGGAPVLAVRLQELFGLTDTPRIAGGRVSVVLHLLSPGYKPVQVTRDLKSFWKSAYVDVRKELKVRYPKHSWPDDPLTAPPVAKGRPQRG